MYNKRQLEVMIRDNNLVKDHGKIHNTGNPFKLFFLLDCDKMFSKECTIIQFINESKSVL